MDIRKIILDAVHELGADVPFVELEVPRVSGYGDLSTPVAMTLAKTLQRSPRSIAEDIASRLSRTGHFETVDVAGPGFINCTFNVAFLYESLRHMMRAPQDFLRRDIGKGQRIQIEYVSANPTGPLHLGHGRGAAVGAALSNLLERAGYAVEREFYVNDAGRQVRLLGESIFAHYREGLGRRYPFPDEGYRGAYVRDLAEAMIRREGERHGERDYGDVEDIFSVYGTEKMLEVIEGDLRTFGVSFDHWQRERDLFNEGYIHQCIEDLKSRGKMYEKDGALWFRASDFGDDKDRVVAKSDGTYTYFASDIAYHWFKIRRGFSGLINVWGADHHGYVPRIKAVIRALGYPEERLQVLLVQMVTLLRGGRPVQMSKRAGEFVTLREVMDEVGADTTKFIFLTRRPDSHLEFDIEAAKKESSENPVYYVQYAYARIMSIFRKAEEQGFRLEECSGVAPAHLGEQEEVSLIKKLLFYPLMLEGAVREREPHRLTFYLQDLAGLFHPYYNTHRVLGLDSETSRARLSLCLAVKTVLREGLSVLGIGAPDRM